MMMKKAWMLTATLLASIATAPVHASEGDVCKKVTLGDVGWSDIAATTGVAMMLLDGLGYEASKTIASPPIVLAGVKKAQIDAFLGYWDPSMTPTVKPSRLSTPAMPLIARSKKITMSIWTGGTGDIR